MFLSNIGLEQSESLTGRGLESGDHGVGARRARPKRHPARSSLDARPTIGGRLRAQAILAIRRSDAG